MERIIHGEKCSVTIELGDRDVILRFVLPRADALLRVHLDYALALSLAEELYALAITLPSPARDVDEELPFDR